MYRITALLLFLFIFYGCVSQTDAIPDANQTPAEPSEEPEKAEAKDIEKKIKGGMLNTDETWSGEIMVGIPVIVPQGVTLKIEPGTVIKFKHGRDYRKPEMVGLFAEGGTIIAKGTSQEMIWFTSDAEDPINGDWVGISLMNSTGSVFDYVIVEFGEMGIMQFYSDASITNSIIRWSNAEGLYAEKSSPLFEKNILYENGYHEIALEQYNEDVIIRENIFHNGGSGWAIHTEATESRIENNYFYDYPNVIITAGMRSNITILNNSFKSGTKQPIAMSDDSTSNLPIAISGDSTFSIDGNNYGIFGLRIPDLNIKEIENKKLGYIPGSKDDRYPYIFEDEDETRKVLKRLGENLGFGWALEYSNGSLYRFSIGSGELGEALDFIMINATSGAKKKFANDEVINPRGLAYDGEFFFVNDFTLLKIFKFELMNDSIRIIDSFDIPEKEKGGTMGLTTDGDFLYLRSRDGSKLYQMTKEGEVSKEIHFNQGLGQAIVWSGSHFWTFLGCGKGICKWSKEGDLVGEVYPAAVGTWAMAWEPADNKEGGYLWTIQRTCESWDDPKIYKIEILDDALNPSTSPDGDH